jgi:two-component system chemotaxis response regulator CheB
MPDGSNEIHVMLVDDSAVIRGALKRLLEGSPHIKVIKSLPDGKVAISSAKISKPHIVILDIEMPVMDGLTALPQILEASPDTKVIMFSSLTEKGAKVTLEALRLGAVECIVKPSSAQEVGEGSPFQRQLTSLIESLVPPHERRASDDTKASQPATTPVKPSLVSKSFELKKDPLAYSGKPAVIAIGSSTGGPQALFAVLKECQNFDVPIVITQHMPGTFTKILAEHIQQHTGIQAQEGQTGMIAEPGQIYVAPGGYHMLFEENAGRLSIVLDDGPAVNFCKPAVDPMLDSLIKIHGNKVLGVILTGMGADGREACKTLVEKKGRLIAQDEATSVVWGMPGAVAQENICSAVLPLNEIGPWIKSAVMR